MTAKPFKSVVNSDSQRSKYLLFKVTLNTREANTSSTKSRWVNRRLTIADGVIREEVFAFFL